MPPKKEGIKRPRAEEKEVTKNTTEEEIISSTRTSGELTSSTLVSGSSGTDHEGRPSGKVKTVAKKAEEILVFYSFKNGVVNFYVNAGQRPDTDLPGGSQGDHTTAYIEILQAILSSVDQNGIVSAIKSLQEFGGLILREKHLERFQSIPELDVHDKNFRGRVEDFMRKGEALDEDIDLASDELKYAKIAKCADYLCELSSCLLRELQLSNAAYYSRGRADKSTKEGDEVKGAARALVAIDKLCKLCDLSDSSNSAKFEKELKKFQESLKPRKKDDGTTEEDHVVRYGLTRCGIDVDGLLKITNNEDQTNQVFFLNLLKDELRKVRDSLTNDTSKIAGFIGDLFDYKRVIEFDLVEAAPLTKSERKEGLEEQKNCRERKMMKFLGDPEGKEHKPQYDHDNDAVIITRKDVEKLIETVDKHLIYTESAFPHLTNKLDRESKKDDVIDKFLEKEVLENQAWQDASHRKGKKIQNVDSQFIKDNLSSQKQPLTHQSSRGGRE